MKWKAQNNTRLLPNGKISRCDRGNKRLHTCAYSITWRDNAELFRNRKRYFSINVQTISDPQLLIRHIVACWHGSTHDSTIFLGSHVRRKFTTNEVINCHLLGDNGYKLEKYLLTPFPNLPDEWKHLKKFQFYANWSWNFLKVSWNSHWIPCWKKRTNPALVLHNVYFKIDRV